MKKAILNIKINVPDDFNIGECDKCPLSVKNRREWESLPGCYWVDVYCKLGFDEATCPLKVKKV